MMMVAIGFPDEAFDPIAIHCMLEIAFGNRNNYLVHNIFIVNRKKIVKTLEGIAEEFFPFLQKIFDLESGTDPFFLRKSEGLAINAFWSHTLSRRRPWRP